MQYILERRVNLLHKAERNPQLQKIEIETCKQDILYFFRNYLYTDKNRTLYSDETPDIIPFIPYPFQEEYITEVWESITEGNKPVKERKQGVLTNVFIEKSRQMGISWVSAAIFLYGFLFHHHKYTIISRTAEEVDKSGDMDSMFEKIRFMIRNLPTWMLPKGFSKEQGRDKTNAYMNISDPNTQASITGKTANPDAGRGGTRNAIFMDEMASMQYAHEINLAAGSNTPCRIFNSTPNGEGNEFYRMRKMTMDRMGPDGKIIKAEIKGLRYHRSEHPLYDAERYKWKTSGMSAEEIAQELEIDYNVSVEGRVYPEFTSDAIDIVYDINKPLYIALDNSHGGSDPNAILVMQPTDHYLDIIDAVEITTTPENCAEFLSCQPRFQITDTQSRFLERYRGYNRQKAIFIGDPYDTMSAMGNSTIYDDYKKVGINIFVPQERDKERQISKTRTNIYRVRYNNNCLDFASAIMNAKYPTRKENSNATTPFRLPVHNRTSHFRTALEYLVNYVLENQVIQKQRVAKDKRVRRDMVTGRII